MKAGKILLTVLAALLLCMAVSLAEEAVFQPVDLPVVYLEIDGGQEEIDRLNGSPDHSYRCSGTMDIVIPDGYDGGFENRYPQETVRGLKLDYIRGRGNGTWDMSKNPYKIKLAEKQDLFGMGKNKHWVLLANYFDNSMLRNRLTAWVGEQMGLEFTPEGVFVEVVMNGDYLGCYYLCEQIRVGKNRVALDELTAEDNALPEIRGGYLLEFCPDDDESPDAFETARGLRLGNMEPSFNPEETEVVSDAQKEYIRAYIQQAEDAVFAGDGYANYLDLQSLADYWWLMEFSANGDAFRTDSAHMFKKRTEADGSEGRLHFGPLWDFDDAWGNTMTEVIQVVGFNNTFFLWTDELRTRPEFREVLLERWQVLDAKLEELVREGGALDGMAAEIRNAWSRDDLRWHASHEEDDTDVGRDFGEEIEALRSWIRLRREWISGHPERLGLVSCAFTVRGEGVEEQTYMVSVDSYVSVYDIPEPEVEGKVFVGWALEDGTFANDFVWADKDITLTAVFEDGSTPAEDSFQSLSGLDAVAAKLENGVTIEKAYYTDGSGWGRNEMTTTDPEEIRQLWTALNSITVRGRTDESMTDWYPLILFYLSDGTEAGVSFESTWLCVDGHQNYELENDEAFWSLTAALMEKYRRESSDPGASGSQSVPVCPKAAAWNRTDPLNGCYQIGIEEMDLPDEESLTLSLYAEDLYAREDIENLKPGDTVLVNGEIRTVGVMVIHGYCDTDGDGETDTSCALVRDLEQFQGFLDSREIVVDGDYSSLPDPFELSAFELISTEETAGYLVFEPVSATDCRAVIDDWSPCGYLGRVTVPLPLPEQFVFENASGDEEGSEAFLADLDAERYSPYNTDAWFENGLLIRISHSDYPVGPEDEEPEQ